MELGPAENDGMAIHTIPVPHGWTEEQAWESICRGDFPDDLDETQVGWGNVLAKGTKLIKVYGYGRHWEEHGPLPEITSEDDDR